MRDHDQAAADHLTVPGELQKSEQPIPLLRLQRKIGNQATTQLIAQRRGAEAAVSQALSGAGQALDPDLRTPLEAHLGADLSGVRIHTGGAAARSAQAVAAEAYTVGDNVVFGAGQYQPDTTAGKHRLAHELTHVVQQRQGPVSGTIVEGSLAVSDPADRFEQAAEANAHAFMDGQKRTKTSGSA